MCKEVVSLTGKFVFIQKEGSSKFILKRNHKENNIYLSQVAAMSFHKTLFGLSELKVLQDIPVKYGTGSLKMSETVFAYYTVYHLITFCMLLDEEYEIIVMKKLKNNKVPLEGNKKLLNSHEDTPERWNNQEQHERDIASMISHSNIKDYCKSLRNRECIKNKIVKLIYDHFISLEFKTIGYEKICYIRDRIVYRPTVVIDDENGGIIQTSADLNEELSKLPSWKQYYQILEDLHKKLIEMYDNSDMVKGLLTYMWRGQPVREEWKLLNDLGWTDEEIQMYRSKANSNELCFDSYISHLIEIRDKERIKKDLREIWFPLRDSYASFFSEYIKKKISNIK
ncbi:hypothetical protein JDS80_13395 [Bacillus cereus group sp. N8]|uniref:hypothetical protein n=1 Tax=Bacillus cereus group sp. N8 TaxID=2794584 RepID=UPI0018F71294|nr:hypothetical protein [Bacillus cereus group sp. N8]MBJ8104821.1 hypothetical protein [Bacillus cereus group sp. N8]